MMTRALSVLLMPLLLAGCAGGQNAFSIFTSPASDVPEGQRFLDQPEFQAAVESRPSAPSTMGLLGPELYESDGLVQAPLMTTYLTKILQRVLDARPGSTMPRSIRIHAAPGVKVFATSQRDIYVSFGLLEELESESQLAAVLAHEAAHIDMNHFAKDEYFQKQRSTLDAGAGLGVLAVTAASLEIRRGDTLQVVQTDPKGAAKDSVSLAAATWLVSTLSDELVSSAWNRVQEEQADLFAADLLPAAGFDPDGTADMLRKVGQLQGEQESFADLMSARRSQIAEDLAQKTSLNAMVAAVPVHLVEISKAGVAAAREQMSLGHPEPKDRQKVIADYVRPRYSGQKFNPQQRAADRETMRDAKSRFIPQLVSRGHHAAQDAIRLSVEGKMVEARRSLAVALGGPVKNSTHARLAGYYVASAGGRFEEAYAHLERIDEDDIKPRRVYEFRADGRLRKRDFEGANRVLSEGEREFGDPEPFLPARITVAVAAGDEAAGRAAHDACRKSPSESLKASCDNAIAPLGLSDLTPAAPPGLLDAVGGAIEDLLAPGDA